MNGAIAKEKKEECCSAFLNRVLGESGGVYTKLTMAKEDYIAMALTGKLKQFPIRPMLWKVFFRLIPVEKPFFEWLSAQEDMRLSYKAKKAKKTPEPKDMLGDPLTRDSGEWKVYYEEKDVTKIIKLDLDRGDVLEEATKRMLSSVLLTWARENKAVSYRQGMNELISMIYKSIAPYYFENKQSLSKEDLFIIYNNSNLRSSKSDELYLYFHDEKELEADLYFLFNALMKRGIMTLYDSTNELKGKEFKGKETAIQERVNGIMGKLRLIDDELYYHFEKIQIAPGAFLQRWLQCLLIREFPFELVIELWDAIFASEFVEAAVDKSIRTHFSMLDSVILAMITRLRDDCILI